MEPSSSVQIVQWGNSLAVRISASVAKAAGFVVGTPLDVSVISDGVFLRPTEPRPTLAQMLKSYDRAIHNGSGP